MNIQWQKETALAMRAAVEGGRITLERPPVLFAERKESARDVVTAVDVLVERHIRQLLSESDFPVFGEEEGFEHGRMSEKQSPVWIVDPIDGTANYANGLDYYAVSVGLCRRAEFFLGAVCMPKATELFCTLGADRSLLNGKTLVHEHRSPEASLVAASFSGLMGDAGRRARQYQTFGDINDLTRGCLRLGSAASNICFTAAGRLQAAYGFQARVWDVAAALAVAIGAGCRIMIVDSECGSYLDYIVGSRDTVAVIHEVCVRNGLMDSQPLIL